MTQEVRSGPHVSTDAAIHGVVRVFVQRSEDNRRLHSMVPAWSTDGYTHCCFGVGQPGPLQKGLAVDTDCDYEHALLEIRRRLHDQRGSKAAVMIGAGFSRNAVPRDAGSARFPLWRDITTGLAERLYPRDEDRKAVLDRAGATSSALRLAQEFETAFGRPALIEFLRDVIREDAFQPGTLHSELLELPWADVFTTNYDRLVEAAALSLWRQHYETVTNTNDLPLARRPRIVKLHGSLPKLDGLILTEDDYRTYPAKFAPFVATVQAALTENVLCLIGFSGDDPNFLAWSGWLRDELRDATPKTYLFTGQELEPFQRQLLESRHIIPIPLKGISGCDSYEEAYHWLFEKLAQRPEVATPAWNTVPRYVAPDNDPSTAAEPLSPSPADWIDTAILWREHRLQYKGWYVLHRNGVQRLRTYTDFWFQSLNAKVLGEWTESVAIFVLWELIWRNSTALKPLDDQFVLQLIDPQLTRFAEWRRHDPEEPSRIAGKTRSLTLPLAELDDAYHALLEECLRHAREIGDGDRFQRFFDELNGDYSEATPNEFDDHQSFLRYQQVLQSLSELRQSEAREQLQSWNPASSDSIWSIRRAGLCLESGLKPLGIRVLETTLARLRSVPVSGSLDIRRMSAEGITLFLLSATRLDERLGATRSDRAADQADKESQAVADQPPAYEVILERLTELRAYGCDPNDHLEWLSAATSPDPKATKGVQEQEGFDIGFTHSTLSSGSEPQATLAYRAMRFIEDAGLPLRIPDVMTTTVAATLFRNIAKTIGFFAPSEVVGLVGRSRDDKIATMVLSRDCLASLADTQINWLFDAAVNALREALARLGAPSPTRDREDAFWEEQLQFACAVVGRVIVRLPDAQIEGVFPELIALPHHPKVRDRHRAHRELKLCICRVAKSLGRPSLHRLLPTMLDTPVPGGAELPRNVTWCDPTDVIADFSCRLESDFAADCQAQIDGLLTAIRSAKGAERVNLCQRAATFLQAGLLSPLQMETFSNSLFTHPDEHGLPADTGLPDSFILSLPEVRDVDEVALFRAKYLEGRAPDSTLWAELCKTRVAVPDAITGARRSVKWLRDDVTKILDLADKWLGVHCAAANERRAQPLSKRQWLGVFGLGNTERDAAISLSQWLAALEDIVLLSDEVTEEQKSGAEKLIERAANDGLCTTQAIASRAYLGSVDVADAVSDIQQRLTSHEQGDIRQAYAAVIRWYELGRTGKLAVPADLLSFVTALVASRRHDFLPVLIATASDVLELVQEEEARALWKRIDPGVCSLLAETEYTASDIPAGYTIGMKLSIRVQCARLVDRAIGIGLSSPTLGQWVRAIGDDVFADVRREAAASSDNRTDEERRNENATR